MPVVFADLYGDLVAPTLNTALYVETWNHGSDEITSCGAYDLHNVDEVYISATDYSFLNSFDHAKWAVAPSNAPEPWICVGDINRMVSHSTTVQ